MWCGRQADALGLAGPVTVEALELLLSGHDPVSGMVLGRELLDRYTAAGEVIRSVAGFDATFSALKSLSVWWALTGDHRLLDAHDAAVTATLGYLERSGSTTRVRANGGRRHPESQGLSMATFRQTTSRADDPQIHTHAVISAKVQTLDGRWLALDGKFPKRHQRMLGGLYQSALRSELTACYGVAWEPIVNGQAELSAIPDELVEVFSKRARQVESALKARWPSSVTAKVVTRHGGNAPRSPARQQSIPALRRRVREPVTCREGGWRRLPRWVGHPGGSSGRWPTHIGPARPRNRLVAAPMIIAKLLTT